jgi:HEAT repeat protein
MDAAEIIQLLEKPTKNVWPFVYQIRDEAAVSDIIAALQTSTNPLTRHLLCYVINLRARVEFFEGKSTETLQAIPALTEALTDPDERVRDAARDALEHLADAMMPRKTAQDLEQLIAQLQSAEADEQREAAATMLGDLVDERTLAPLLALLQHEQGEVRYAAALTLAYMGESRDTDWFVRGHREQVQGPLIQALQDTESGVRAATAQALNHWGDSRAVEPLLGIIHDKDAEVRRQVIETLGYPKDERTLEPLLHAFFTDPDAKVRAYAAQGLGYFDDRRAVDSLIHDLQDEQPALRRNAAEMLCRLKDERAADALIQALQDSDQEVREWAMEALWWLCCDKGDALLSATEEKIRQSLPLALQDESSEVRESAAKIADWLD